MFAISALELSEILKSSPAGRQFELREPDGAMLWTCSRHEAETLAFFGVIEGISNKNGLKYLRLTAPKQQAARILRRMIYSSGRTVAEASQLIFRNYQPRSGVTYAHNVKRTKYYQPCFREQFLAEFTCLL